MGVAPKPRPSKEECYLAVAEEVARRSTCRRRKYGAVIVKDDEIISTGYGGAPRGTADCCGLAFCYRERLGARRGEHYEFCRAVHAEQNAIIHAPRREMLGSKLYLVGLDAQNEEPDADTEPCRICRRIIVNAGIAEVIAAQGGGRVERFLVQDWVKNNLFELQEDGGQLVPVRPPRTLGERVDEDRRAKLMSRYALTDAVVVQVSSYEQGKHAVGRVGARYFVDNIKSGDAVGLSCGDTVLSLLESLPYQQDLRLTINQLSIEGDPAMIHQAPATLVGLLRSKCSPESDVIGVQLPPLGLVPSSGVLRQELIGSKFMAELKRRAASSNFLFIGVGTARAESRSFWAMAQSATDNQFDEFVKQLGLVGEINNRVFDRSGNDCTDSIQGFDTRVVNVLTLDDIRAMACEPLKHKVVIVATGGPKTEAIRVALKAGLANVLITGREDADRLLAG